MEYYCFIEVQGHIDDYYFYEFDNAKNWLQELLRDNPNKHLYGVIMHRNKIYSPEDTWIVTQNSLVKKSNVQDILNYVIAENEKFCYNCKNWAYEGF